MPAQNYDRRPQLATLRGMNLTLPGDRLAMEWAQLLRNLRSYRVGEWRQRPGLQTQFNTTSGSPVLFLRRLNNPVTGGYKLIAATAAGGVWDDTPTLLDNGYGSQGYSSVVARPDASPQPFLFLASAERQGKFDVDGVRTAWGLKSPVTEPVLELELPAYGIVDRCQTTAGFAVSGGVLSAPTRVNTTIQYILYDTGPGRWACCAPTAMDENIQEGALIEVSGGGGEVVIVDKVFPAIATTTVQAVEYDSGVTGPCCVQMAVPTLGLERDMLLLLNGEAVRVLSVTEGPNGIPSFRCSTVGTLVAGNAVVGLRSFRAVFAAAHVPGDTLTSAYVQVACAGAGLATVSKTGVYDLARTTNTYLRPMQPEDFIHISVKVADWTQVTEIQLQFDCDASVNDFSRNYFFKSLRPPDLQTAIAQTGSSLTAQQQQIQREQIDRYVEQQGLDPARIQEIQGQWFYKDIWIRPIDLNAVADANGGGGFVAPTGEGPLSSPGVSGDAQWTEMKISLREFERVGSDLTRGWQNVAAFRVTVNTAAAVDVGVSSIWFGGTFGPDVRTKKASAGGGVNYVYRMRNSSTGSTSAFSPPARSPVYPRREGVLVRGEALYNDTQADVIDYFRIGGTLGSYHYVGTAPLNDPTLLDTIDDSAAVRNEIAVFDRFQPWTRTDLPQQGTCNVVGTSVEITAGTLDTSYVRNNLILIDGVAYTFYSKPESTSRVQLNESAGALTGVSWEISNPTMEGQALPVVFGPYSGGASGEFVFGCGDPVNPAYVHYTLGNDPEACTDGGYLELSTPNEPMMAGTVLDGVIFVWSTARSWRILPSFDGGQSGASGLFYAQETGMGKGLASPWALAAGDALYWVAWDGVWSSRGDAIESLTDESLSPLFKKDGTYVQGGPFQGLSPISFVEADQRWLSLTYSKDGLYLTYRGLDGGYYNLFYSFLTRGWIVDSYVQDVHRFCREEGDAVDAVLVGANNGIVYLFDANVSQDNGQPIECVFVGRAEDWGDTRAQKLVGDLMVDCNPGGNTLLLNLQLDNATGAETPQPSTMTGNQRAQFLFDLNNGGGWLARNAALELSWQTVADSLTRLYEWQPAALRKPEATVQRATDWDDAGSMGNKWLQGLRLVCDTYEEVKTFRVETDGAFMLAELSVQTSGEQEVAFSWTPGTTHQMRIVGTDDKPWRVIRWEWVWEPEPELAQYWHTQFMSLDQTGYMHIRDMLVALRSTSDVFMFVNWDEQGEDSYTLASTGGERQKVYVPVLGKKGKVAHFRFYGVAPFSLYLNDIEVRAKSWGREMGYEVKRPFGDLAHTNGGARI